jgi:hypothetical protein
MTWTRSALHVLLAASVAANIWLGYRSSKLELRLHSMTARPGPTVGSRAPELDVTTAAGERVRVRYSETPLSTVLYVVSPGCQWCARNASSVAEMARLLDGRVRFVGLSLPGNMELPAPFVDTLPFPVYSGLSESGMKELHVRSTPTTILVSPAGCILGVWEGAYGGETKAALEVQFGVRLPDFDGA